MKIWHDDIRRPPDDTWDVWVRSNHEAKTVLIALRKDGTVVDEISLDHDLGLEEIDPDIHNAIYLKGNSEDDGLKLVDWMIEFNLVPEKVVIHSMNPVGADRMRKTLARHGHFCQCIPFRAPQC